MLFHWRHLKPLMPSIYGYGHGFVHNNPPAKESKDEIGSLAHSQTFCCSYQVLVKVQNIFQYVFADNYHSSPIEENDTQPLDIYQQHISVHE
jgi:hypothetical protein